MFRAIQGIKHSFMTLDATQPKFSDELVTHLKLKLNVKIDKALIVPKVSTPLQMSVSVNDFNTLHAGLKCQQMTF